MAIDDLPSGNEGLQSIIAENERLKELLTQSLLRNIDEEKVGRVFHDFNNILSSSMGYASLAVERSQSFGDEKLTRYLDNIERAGIRARNLVRDSLSARQTARNAHQSELRALLVEKFSPEHCDAAQEHVYFTPAQLGFVFDLLNGLWAASTHTVHSRQQDDMVCEACGAELRGLQLRLEVCKNDGWMGENSEQNNINLTLATSLINSNGGHLCESLVQDKRFVVYLRSVVSESS